MSFIEGNWPYVNQHGLNLDWLLKTVKDHTTRIEKLEADYINIVERLEVVEGSVTNIQEQITIIQEQIEGLDLDAIYQLIHNVNIQSIWRDEELARRIALLEQAVIHDIYNYIGSENLILFGSDLRNLPENAISEYNLPVSMSCGSTVDSQGTPCAVKLTKYGITANEAFSSGYQYFTLGRMGDVPRTSNTLANPITVTFGICSTTEPTETPTEEVITIAAINTNYPSQSFGGLNVRLSRKTNDDFLLLDVRGAGATLKTALTNKYLTYVRVEYGSASSGIRYNNDDSKIYKYLPTTGGGGGVTPSDVISIVRDNLELIMDTEVYEEEFPVTLTPADGSHDYDLACRLDLRLQKTAGYLSGILAFNVIMGNTQTMNIDLTKTFETHLDTTSMRIPKKTVLADTIHAFTDLFTGAQFNVVLSNGDSIAHPVTQICDARVWGAMKPITITNNGLGFCTIGVVKIFEPCDWTLQPPV